MCDDPSPDRFAEAALPGFVLNTPITPANRKTEDFRKDHRNRLRQRFFDGGAAAMPDYELLELLLFRVIPRQDVKPIAKRLIAEIGDFNQVLAASKEQLMRVKGVGARLAEDLKVVEAAAHRMALVRIMDQPILTSWDALLDYCNATMAYLPLEQFRILYLDKKNVLIADEEQQKGTVDHVPVYPREVVKRALELNASALILVHNHPSGDPTPSQSDLDMTARINQAADIFGVVVHDHLIIGKSGNFSFRSEGHL